MWLGRRARDWLLAGAGLTRDQTALTALGSGIRIDMARKTTVVSFK